MEEKTLKKRKTLIYLLSILPGLGHFYLGLMTRGLQFMLLFFGTIFLTRIINSFGFFLPIIVFYSYFDALQFHSRYREGNELLDEPIFKQNVFGVNKTMIGWGLIGIGCFTLLQYAADYIQQYYNIFVDVHFIRNLLFSLVFVLLGIRLLRGKPGEN
jgi:hypothetical protein